MSSEGILKISEIIKDIKLNFDIDKSSTLQPKANTEKPTKYGKRHFCDRCGKGFAKRCGLKTHQLIHEGVKPFSCEICAKTFTKKCTLTVHLLTHTSDRPYVCEICDKSFARKSDLKKHSFTHLGIRPHLCQICNKGFTRRNTLRKHELTHLPKKKKEEQNSLKKEKPVESPILDFKTLFERSKQSLLSCNVPNIESQISSESNISSIHELGNIELYEKQFDELNPFLTNSLDCSNKTLLQSEFCEEFLCKDLSQLEDSMFEYSLGNISFNDGIETCDTESYTLPIVDSPLSDIDQKEGDKLPSHNLENIKQLEDDEINNIVATIPVFDINLEGSKQKETYAVTDKKNMVLELAKIHKFLSDNSVKNTAVLNFPNSTDRNFLTSTQIPIEINGINFEDIEDVMNTLSLPRSDISIGDKNTVNLQNFPNLYKSFQYLFNDKSSNLNMQLIDIKNNSISSKCLDSFDSFPSVDTQLAININEICERDSILDSSCNSSILSFGSFKNSLLMSEINNVANCSISNLDINSSIGEDDLPLGFFENFDEDDSSKSNSKKIHACYICDKIFTKSCTLKTHLMIHEGIKPFSCNICDKSFTKKCTLTGHLLTHETNRPFICEVCQKSFVRKNDLHKHSFVHAEVKPHVCTICGRGYTQQTKLRKHQMTHHLDAPILTDSNLENLSDEQLLLFDSKSAVTIASDEFSGNQNGSFIFNEIELSNRSATEIYDVNKEANSFLQQKEDTLTGLDKHFKCNNCDSNFVNETQLQIHLLTHINILVENKNADKLNEEKNIVVENSMEFLKMLEMSNNTLIELENCVGTSTEKDKSDASNIISLDTITEKFIDDNFSTNSNTDDKLVFSNDLTPNTLQSSENTVEVIENKNSEDLYKTSKSSYNSTLLKEKIKSLPNVGLVVNNKSKEIIRNHACHICDKKYASKSSLKAHVFLHANMKPYICEVCYTTFAKKCSLTVHSLIHTGERPHVCYICDKRFARKYDLHKHSLTHTGEKPYRCDVCQASFNHQNNLRRHKRIHTGEKPHVCKCCHKSFADASVLLTHSKRHVRDAELTMNIDSCIKSIKERLHMCDICKMEFARRDRLLKHMLTHNNTLYSCNVCNHISKSQDQLQSHLLIHVQVSLDDLADNTDVLDDLDLTKLEPTVQNINKTFSCSLCVKVFSSKKALKGHHITHTGEKPHKCHICHKGFTQRITLKRHMVVHTNERPFNCNMCKKAFTRKTSLLKHITIHSQKNLF